MAHSIDEIYDLFLWDNSLSPEEIEARRAIGIKEAATYKNLFPFLQPIIVPPENSKMVWEPCATVIAMRSDAELKPYLFHLLQWIQDNNWPGSTIIYDRLVQMPFSMLEFPYDRSRKIAEQTNDSLWLDALDELYEDICKRSQP